MLNLIESILILLAVAIGLGEVFNLLNLPEVVGAIIAGVILGPAVFGVLTPNTDFSTIDEIALFFIILQIGIEASSDVFTLSIGYMLRFTFLAFLVPLAIMTTGAHFIFHVTFLRSLIVSLAVAIPSISITSVLLIKSGLIKAEAGLKLLGGVALSDLIAFVILSSVGSTSWRIAEVAASLTAFIIFLGVFDRYLKLRSEGLIHGAERFMERREGLVFAIVIIMGLAVSSLFEYIGITFVLGAFFSGLIIHRNTVGERVHGTLMRTFQRINNSFFIPIFFSISGLLVTRLPITLIPLASFLVIVTSVVGGTLSYLIAKRLLREIRPATALGIFGGRGAVGVIIATISLSRGLISDELYSMAMMATVVMAIVFTFIFDLSMRGRAIAISSK
ncbi:MAG: cation:proton antiporter [Thermoplasmata archaeon]